MTKFYALWLVLGPLLTIFAVAFKLEGTVAASWLMVFCPLWLPLAWITLCLLALFFTNAVNELGDRYHRYLDKRAEVRWAKAEVQAEKDLGR